MGEKFEDELRRVEYLRRGEKDNESGVWNPSKN